MWWEYIRWVDQNSLGIFQVELTNIQQQQQLQQQLQHRQQQQKQQQKQQQRQKEQYIRQKIWLTRYSWRERLICEVYQNRNNIFEPYPQAWKNLRTTGPYSYETVFAQEPVGRYLYRGDIRA